MENIVKKQEKIKNKRCEKRYKIKGLREKQKTNLKI